MIYPVSYAYKKGGGQILIDSINGYAFQIDFLEFYFHYKNIVSMNSEDPYI